MSPTSSDVRPKRRLFQLVDPHWQLSASRRVATSALIVGAVYAVSVFLFVAPERLSELTASQIGLLAVVVNAAYFAVLLAVLVVAMIRVTHSVAGPARVIERALDGMRHGQFEHRLTLRDRDYLKPVAAAVEGLAADMHARADEQRRVFELLHEALGREDLAEARALAGRLRAAGTAEEQPAPEMREAA